MTSDDTEDKQDAEEALDNLPSEDEFEAEFPPKLPVERRDNDELVIDVSEGAIEQIDDVARERDEHTEIEFLNAVRKAVKYAQAPGFDVETAEDAGAQGGDEHGDYTDPSTSGLRSGKGTGLLRRLFRDND